MEASGTSGMKVVCNGGLNLSILDGWWCEAYEIDSNAGWAIGKGEEYDDLNLQDEVEANALYNLLEHEVIPEFYTRGEDGLPRRWIDKMKASIGKLTPEFNTNRMVQEYLERFYLTAADNCHDLAENNFSKAKELAVWIKRIREQWRSVKIDKVTADTSEDYVVGAEMTVSAEVSLGSLTPEDVAVEVYYGPLDQQRKITKADTVVLQPKEGSSGSSNLFEGSVPCMQSGQHGFTLRVLPRHEHLVQPYQLGLILWQ